MSVVALIPAFQAEATVAEVVRRTRPCVPELLVLDDGSSDRTSERARAAGARVHRFERNRGKGAALRAGFAWALDAGAEAVVTLDADGQHDPREIAHLIDTWRASGAALVIGSRTHLEERMRPTRRFGNRFARGALSLFAGVDIADGQSGFRLYDAELLRVVRLSGTRYELESEVIVKAARGRFRIESAPIRLLRVDGTGTSHFRPWRDTARICARVVLSRFEPARCS